MKFCRITFTTDALENGKSIISDLLTLHWIACAQISGPIESHYHWKGQREKTAEWKFELKTMPAGLVPVANFIHKHHSYEVPEILMEEVESVNPDFSQWLRDECNGLAKSGD